MSVAQILLLIAKEFSDLQADELNAIIELADLQVAKNLCGENRNTLVAYLAAHILTVAGKAGGATGDVESITEGHKSITYSNSNADVRTSLSRTSYGQEFDRLAKSCIFSARTRMSNVNLR